MNRFKLTISLLALLPALCFSQAKLVEKVVKKGNEIVIPYEKYVLPNGLTIIVHEDHSDPVVHVDVTYHVGSAREEIGKSGFAHFFEHMMFNGSDHVADEQHFGIITEAGGTLNGSTNLDRTNYYETIPSNQLEKVLWLESDRMGFLLDAVTQKKFEIQRATVKNERGQNYDNRAYGLVGEVASRNLYPYGHPYSWLTIGYVEELNKVNVNDLKNFFLRWYGPNNATLTVGGDVQPKEVVRLAEKYFGSIPRGPEVTPVKVEPVKIEKDRYVSFTDDYARNPQLRIVYPTIPQYHPDAPALSCLAAVLGQGGGGGGGRRGGRGGGGGGGARNSVFYQYLVKPQKALQASANSSQSELAGEFTFSVTPYPDHSLSEMDGLIKDALNEFEKRGVTDEDIEKFKSTYESRTINGLASVSGKASRLAEFQTFTGNPNMIGKLLDMYMHVTKEDVMRVYEKYIKNKPRLVVSTVTQGKEDLRVANDNYTIDKSHYVAPDYGYSTLKYKKPVDNFNRSLIPPSGPNPVVKVPPYWTKKLANGMDVMGTQNTEIPVIAVNITLKGGRILEQNDLSKLGLTNLFASLMNDNTEKYTSEELTAELDKLGSSISINNTFDGITFSVSSLRKNLDKTMELLEERMLHPKFSNETLTRIKRQLTESINNNMTSATSMASEVFARVNYGEKNILGLPANGTRATLQNISLSDIQSYYDNYISSEGARVVVVGDIKQEEILPKLSFLEKLPKKSITLPTLPSPLVVVKPKIYLVNIPKAAQTEFRVGGPVRLRYDANGDYYKATLANYTLGGGFNSRVNQNLREDKGWTYGARSALSADQYQAQFQFSSGIKAEATDSALAEVIKEIGMYYKGGARPEEIAFMRKSIGQADARNYETGIQKASFIGRILEYHLPSDYVTKQTQILNTINKKELDQLIRRYIDPASMNIVLAGDKKKILPGLQRLGYEIVEINSDGSLATSREDVTQ